jgi:hypothetical protein
MSAAKGDSLQRIVRCDACGWRNDETGSAERAGCCARMACGCALSNASVTTGTRASVIHRTPRIRFMNPAENIPSSPTTPERGSCNPASAGSVCPDCGGAGGFMVHVCGGDDERCYRLCPDVSPCQRCNATGLIDTPNDSIRCG